MAEDAQQPVDRIIEIDRLALYAPALEGDTRSPRLAWCIYKGNPRLTVFTNTKTDSVSSGIIPAPMDPRTFFAFLEALRACANGEPGKKGKVTCLTSNRDDNGNGSATGEKVLLSEIVYGKDDQGIVWISVIAKDRPRIKFEHHISDYHEIFHGDGTPLSKSESSAAHAIATIDLAKEIYSEMIKEWNDNKPASGGNTSYAQRNQSKPQAGGQQYTPKKTDLSFDDDVF